MDRIVFAPDAFKGTASATDAAAALAHGWRSIRPHDELVLRPMADGGEGTFDAFERAIDGARRMPVTVQGPDDRAVEASWLWLPAPGSPAALPALARGGRPGGTGVVELANTSGLALLDVPLPLDAHTQGFGQAIAAALDAGVDRLLLALGGSASTDGGVGALTALGAVALDAANRPIRRGNRGLGTLARLDLGHLRALPPGGATILSDVTNPLLGARGAAAVFGPQKGATPAIVGALEANLVRFVRLVPAGSELAATPGAGAAGGTGFGLLAWGAALAPGAVAVGDALGIPAALAGASVVVTGEGRFDAQSLAGKVVSYVLARAADAAVPVALVAGAIEGDTSPFRASVSLTELAGADGARTATLHWLREAGARLARTLERG